MSFSAAIAEAKLGQENAGLAFWMERVLEECDRASVDFAADPVHDLRVALRRCRSMADGLRAIDPDPAWKQVKKAGKQLFGRLGELRDLQVMEKWVQRLGTPDDPVAPALLRVLSGRENLLKQQAAQAVREFDRKQWKRWSTTLPRRAARIKKGSAAFQHLALEKWVEAHELHSRALRSRSQIAFHQLRIGIKRFRYILENFVPDQHESWIDDLKELQDLLGEIHDLDVLWSTALQINAFTDELDRARWHARINQERIRRIDKYRAKMLGAHSLWHVWRADLPAGKALKTAASTRLRLWASFLDPDFKHSRHVARLALQLYDGLPARQLSQNLHSPDERDILQMAALLHDVGRSRDEKGHHKAGWRLIRELPPPLGWSGEKLRLVGIVGRYHRGALPAAGQKTWTGLHAKDRSRALRLAGILRLANAFDCNHDGRIQKLHVREHNGTIVIEAQGYSARHRSAERVAAARHLLEVVYRCPVLVKSLNLSRKLNLEAAR